MSFADACVKRRNISPSGRRKCIFGIAISCSLRPLGSADLGKLVAFISSVEPHMTLELVCGSSGGDGGLWGRGTTPNTTMEDVTKYSPEARLLP